MAKPVERSRPRRRKARPGRLALFCVLLLAATGCRTDPAIVLLEQENRKLEDMIYRQQDLIEQYRRALGSGCADCGVPDDRAQPATTRTGETPYLTLPEVVGPALPGSSPSTAIGPSAEAPPTESSPQGQGPDDHQSTVPKPQTDNTRVRQITLRPWSGRADNVGRRSGDEGLNLLIEPRDAEGRLVAAAAPVSVVVLDPALTGEAARVARWDFAAEEIAARLATTTDGQGILLEAAWPAGPPNHSRLHVFVRYTTDDGRRVEADRAIEVALAGEEAPRWQPALAKAAAPPAARTTAEERQRRAATQTEPSPTEPTRTASRPAQPRSHDRPAAKLQPPVWSPDRP